MSVDSGGKDALTTQCVCDDRNTLVVSMCGCDVNIRVFVLDVSIYVCQEGVNICVCCGVINICVFVWDVSIYVCLEDVNTCVCYGDFNSRVLG